MRRLECVQERQERQDKEREDHEAVKDLLAVEADQRHVELEAERRRENKDRENQRRKICRVRIAIDVVKVDANREAKDNCNECNVDPRRIARQVIEVKLFARLESFVRAATHKTFRAFHLLYFGFLFFFHSDLVIQPV